VLFNQGWNSDRNPLQNGRLATSRGMNCACTALSRFRSRRRSARRPGIFRRDMRAHPESLQTRLRFRAARFCIHALAKSRNWFSRLAGFSAMRRRKSAFVQRGKRLADVVVGASFIAVCRSRTVPSLQQFGPRSILFSVPEIRGRTYWAYQNVS